MELSPSSVVCPGPFQQQNPGASSSGPHSLDQASNQQLQQDQVGLSQLTRPGSTPLPVKWTGSDDVMFVLQEQLDLLRLEEEKLLEQIQRVEADLRLEENLQEKLNRQADVGLLELRPPPARPLF